jgi:23S rRNA pseudouridine1911/1915/1917 synthase
VLERFRGVSLVSVNLMTGRTHQIRVHMAAIGHPVVGDRTYGSRRKAPGAARQMLHAQRLTLTHPQTLELMTFEAPVPADMQVLLDSLRRAS